MPPKPLGPLTEQLVLVRQPPVPHLAVIEPSVLLQVVEPPHERRERHVHRCPLLSGEVWPFDPFR